MAETLQEYLRERDYIDPQHVEIASQAWVSATKAAEALKPSHNKQSTQNYACPKCGAVLSATEYRTGECNSCCSAISA